jgi:protein phosphatase
MAFHVREFKLASQTPSQTVIPYVIDYMRVQGAARLMLRQRFGVEMGNLEAALPVPLSSMLRIGVTTSAGTRPRNEDSSVAMMSHFGDDQSAIPVILLAVADGLGGNADGDVASALAVKVLTESVVNHMAAFAAGAGNADLSAESMEKLLIEAIAIAHHEVRAGTTGGSTTLTCALIVDRTAYVAHIGDCRAYLTNTGWKGMELITRDHRRERQVKVPAASPAYEIAAHRRAHTVTRVLGRSETCEVDLTRRNLVNGSRLLLCSNGIWEHVSPEVIFIAIQQSNQPQVTCESLTSVAIANQADDDMTALLVEMPG